MCPGSAYRIAFGLRAGQKVLTLRGAMPRDALARQALCADIDGSSLHAAVRVEAHERKRLEQLCRCITRPALSDERVQVNAAGQVELKLKSPWRRHLAPGVEPAGVHAAVGGAGAAAASEVEPVRAAPHRISWARLLKRFFDIDMHTCPNCGAGELKIIAAILERPVIQKILEHLGLDPQPPPKGRAPEPVLHATG